MHQIKEMETQDEYTGEGKESNEFSLASHKTNREKVAKIFKHEHTST